MTMFMNKMAVEVQGTRVNLARVESMFHVQDKAASQVQLFVGLWWNSFDGTRTLEERKLLQYMDMLLAFSMRKTLSLRERQTVAGRMQRAVLTMPPGASCLLANIFLLMVGLSVAWQKRRTTRQERQDYK